jgi:DNA-nicking Smr family endonuclease
MAKLSDLKKLVAEARATAAPPPKDSAQLATRATKGLAPSTPLPARPAVPAISPGRALAAQKHAAGDIDLTQAFADVQRLPPSTRRKHAPPRPPPIPAQRIADERDALEASKYGDEPAPDSWEIGQEFEGEQTFLRRGLGTDILSKLRGGHWSVRGELDLHGLNSEEARDVLADFLVAARQHGDRCVRVIHGKGLTSPGREPVLKGKVRRWLAQWDDVLAYCEAPRHAGGGGAVLILLRGRSPG